MNCFTILSILLLIGAACIIGIAPVSAEIGYTQKWVGSPDWLNEKANASVETDLFKQLQEGTDKDKNNFEYINEGKDYLRGGDYKHAKESFELGMSGNSELFDAWLGRGLSLEGTKKYQTALDSFEYAIGLSKNNKHAYVAYAGKGRALLELQKYPEALKALNLAIEKYNSSGLDNKNDLSNLNDAVADANSKIGKVKVSTTA